MIRRLQKHVDVYLVLAVLLSLPVLGPLLQPGYYWGAHDARHAVYFLHQFNLAIAEGIWYPRWAPDFAFGYGYPFFNIYGPLSSYAGQLFVWLGLNIVTAVKTVFGWSAVLSGVTMYLFVRRLMGRPAGLVAALTYVYIPYHLFDLYVRAALAESVGFVFVPLALWGYYELVTRPRLTALLWTGLAYAGVMFTSNLLALIFTPLLGLYVAVMITWQAYETHGFRWLPFIRSVIVAGLAPGFGLVVGLCLSAIFWLPAFTEYQFVRVDQWVGGRFAFGDDFVELYQLFSPRWGFGASIPGPDDDAGFQVGLAALVLFMLSFWLVPRLSEAGTRRTLYIFQGLTLTVLFLTTPISDLVWRVLPLSSFAQFPWRLLVVVAPLMAVLAGAILAQEPDADNRPSLGVVALSGLVLLASYPYVQAQVRDPRPTEGPVSVAALYRFQQSSDEMTGQTAWVRRIPTWSSLAEEVERGGDITSKVSYPALPPDVGVYSMEMSSVHELLWVGTPEDGRAVTFLVPYYPGWTATLYEDLGPHDGNLDAAVGPVMRIGPVVDRPAIQVTDPEGWMVVAVPAGSHFLELRFEDTPVRVLGRQISAGAIVIVAVLFLGAWGWRRWRKQS